MSVTHLFPRLARLLLALSLVLSPMLSVLPGGMAMASMTPGQPASAGHQHHHVAPSTGGQQDQAKSGGCQQHDSCSGQCCSGCAHCTAMPMAALLTVFSPHPLLAPPLSRFLPTAFVSLRERPPRHLS